MLLNVFALALCFANPTPATQTLDAAGTLRIERPRGELNIEGWDQPKVEISVIGTDAGAGKAERRGDEIVISTNIPPHDRRKADVTHNGLTYTIKVPRDSKIVIDRGEGGVYLRNIAGDIDATVHHGQVTLSVPEGAAYKITARSRFGNVYSDLGGDDKRRHLFSHTFTGGADSAAHKLDLRVDYGDVVMMKDYKSPVTPLSSAKETAK
jgi:hypothetical protein